MRNLFFRFSSVIWLASLFAVNSWADHRLNNPIGQDGYYIVKWDCNATGPNGEQGYWAESNDMEYDETFVLAVDLTGTGLENWVKSAQSRNGVTYPVDNTIVSLNTFRGSRGANEYKDNRARLWHIRDNIYGAMYNFAQFETKNGWTNSTPAMGEQTKIYSRIFPSATLFSDHCYPIEPSASQKKGSVWDYRDEWYCAQNNQPLFVFAPYTGTKTGAAFTTQEMTPGTHIFYDNDHYVVGNGYAAPCAVNDDQCCPFFYPLDPVTQTIPVGADSTLVAEAKSGNLTGVSYQWYRYETAAGEATAVPYTGTGAQTKTCHPATNEGETDYTYYCFITTDNCPDGVYTTHAQVIVEKLCPEYTITVDGAPVSGAQTFYPGGWYVIGCTSTAGAPTSKVLPAGAKAHFGHDTLYIHTDATTAPLTIEFPTAETAQYAACSGMLTGLISQCGEDQAYIFKWDDNKGYVMDNNGVVQMLSSGINDNTADRWLALPTGDPQVLGKDVVYLYNLTTNRYLYHGPVQAADGGNMDYAAAITSPTFSNSAEYKWIFYQGDQNRIYIMNLSGWTGNWQQALVLHCRDWEYMYCQGNNSQYDIQVCKPDMKVGKMVGYDVSGEMHTSVQNLKTVTGTKATLPPTAIGWQGKTPTAIVNLVAGQDTTFTAIRTDDTHSVNKRITYSSSDEAVATVDAATGKVTAVSSGTATITAKLEDAGCFDGAEISYQVKVQGCSDFTWSIDNEPGLSKLLYPGGWYMLSCTNDDGAPTITVTGTGVTTGAPTTSGNTTTVKVTLSGNASGEIKIKAENPLVGSYKLCPDSVIITVSDCPTPLTAAFKTSVSWQGATPPAEIVANTVGQTYTYTIVRTDDLHSINSAISYESTDPAVATVDATTGKVTIVAASGECDIWAILEDVGCFKGDTLTYHVRLYDCTQDITTHTDYILPQQPKTTEDCSYIVLWDCANDTWASDNTMEWGETFVFAVNLAGTALGDWAMKPASDPALERSIAFDRFRVKSDESTQFNLDASRLWHIRDTIFGAEFNFSQIPYTNGSYYTPAMGEQTEIAARLFGQETAKGAKCGEAGPAKACNWWQWSNAGSLQSQFTGEWLEGSYVSNNDLYLFRFAPYTGKSDPVIKPADDDSRDQWYDNHYFTTINGYRSPCPKAWPTDQSLSTSATSICLEKEETASIQLSGSESGWNYSLYQNGSEMSGSTQAGNGGALTWDELGVGEYTILASATDEAAQHSDWMGDCSHTSKITITAEEGCVEPEVCEDVIYRKWDDLLFVDNSNHLYTAYQWYCNDAPLDGETRQFLYTEGVVLSGDGKTYYCLLTLADGTTVKACANLFDAFPASVAADKQQQAPKAVKYIDNGRLYIRHGDKTYNGQGACVTGL